LVNVEHEDQLVQQQVICIRDAEELWVRQSIGRRDVIEQVDALSGILVEAAIRELEVIFQLLFVKILDEEVLPAEEWELFVELQFGGERMETEVVELVQVFLDGLYELTRIHECIEVVGGHQIV